MNDLPEIEVLARLPLQEVLRVRCVCKSWRDVILDPGFIQRHQALNHISTGVFLAYSEFVRGTMLLNPRRNEPAWIRASALDCPTHPAGILVAASGGLLCYAVSSLNDDGEVVEMDFVIWNPVTNQRNQLPTLHVEAPGFVSTRPYVTMVVRQGRLHQLWVSLFLAVAVFDCFISKESMQTRIANSGNRMKPLPNSWVEFWLYPGDRILIYANSKITYNPGQSLELVDVDNFTISNALWDEEVDRCLAWKGGVACLFKSWTMDAYIFSAIHFVPKRDECVVRREELCHIPTGSSLAEAKSTLDSTIYMISFDRGGECLVHMEKDTQGRLEAVSVQHVEHPRRCASVEVFEPSLSDSPGSCCDVSFNWDLVKFPEENKQLEWVW